MEPEIEIGPGDYRNLIIDVVDGGRIARETWGNSKFVQLVTDEGGERRVGLIFRMSGEELPWDEEQRTLDCSETDWGVVE